MSRRQEEYAAKKNGYSPQNSSPSRDAEKDADDVRRVPTGDAAVFYSDATAAGEAGSVSRGLKSRHIQFIALGGTIGTGLFLGIGEALSDGGPLSILLGYTITGLFIFAMMQSLGEMATWLPLPGAIPQFAARYVDPAMGFAVGWNQWYSNALTQCSEISAAATLIAFWAPDISPAPWITIIIVFIVCLNIFAVKIYGEAEFLFASIKIITIFGLLIFAFIVDLGGNPLHDRIGFRYWVRPGAMTTTVAVGNAGRFLSFFSTLVNAAFSYGGVEAVAVAAGEAEDPRRNIPKAVRRVFWRILFFYFLGSLAVGVLVPSDDSRLSLDSGTGTSSPWVIAINRLHIQALPSIINAVILTSAASSGNAFLYQGSRYLYALAQNRQAPKFLLKTNKAGVPVYCVAATGLISCLTYLSVGSGSSTVFEWFLHLTTIANLFTWSSICISSIKFQKALKAQGVSRSSLPFRAPGQPIQAYAALLFFAIIIVFNGWEVFTHGHWSVEKFITAYAGIPIYFGLYIFWKIFKRTKVVKAHEADIWTGKEAIDQAYWPPVVAKNLLQKFWFWLA